MRPSNFLAGTKERNSFAWLSYHSGIAFSWHGALQLSWETNELQQRIIRNCYREKFWVAGSYDSTLHAARCTRHTVDKWLQAAVAQGVRGKRGGAVEPLAVHKRNGSNNKLGNQLSVRNGNFAVETAGRQDKWLARQEGQRAERTHVQQQQQQTWRKLG